MKYRSAEFSWTKVGFTVKHAQVRVLKIQDYCEPWGPSAPSVSLYRHLYRHSDTYIILILYMAKSGVQVR